MSRGAKSGGRAPYGYTWHDGALVLVPEEVPVYAELFDLFLLHQRKRTAARLLNEKGYRTRAGKHFTYTTVDRMLKNPVAKGMHRISVTEKGGQHKSQETSVPSIVNEDIWNQAQTIMETSAKQTRIPAQDVFMGKAVCGCKKPMEIVYKSNQYSCCQCDTQIPIEDVHAIFEKAIEEIPFPDAKALDELTGEKNPHSEHAIKLNITQLEKKIEKLIELYSEDAIPITTFKSRHKKLNSQLEQLSSTLEQTEKTPRQEFSTLLEFWITLNTKTKQVLLDIVLDHIRFESNVASLSLYPLFNFVQLGNETPSNGANLNIGSNT